MIHYCSSALCWQVSSLGQGSDHVMDAISECEQLFRDNASGKNKKSVDFGDSEWQLFYRKEIFTPWHDVEFDDVATDLIYKQIVQGVITNEYKLRSVRVVILLYFKLCLLIICVICTFCAVFSDKCVLSRSRRGFTGREGKPNSVSRITLILSDPEYYIYIQFCSLRSRS